MLPSQLQSSLSSGTSRNKPRYYFFIVIAKKIYAKKYILIIVLICHTMFFIRYVFTKLGIMFSSHLLTYICFVDDIVELQVARLLCPDVSGQPSALSSRPSADGTGNNTHLAAGYSTGHVVVFSIKKDQSIDPTIFAGNTNPKV